MRSIVKRFSFCRGPRVSKRFLQVAGNFVVPSTRRLPSSYNAPVQLGLWINRSHFSCSAETFSEAKFHEVADETLDEILDHTVSIEDSVENADINLSVRLPFLSDFGACMIRRTIHIAKSYCACFNSKAFWRSRWEAKGVGWSTSRHPTDNFGGHLLLGTSPPCLLVLLTILHCIVVNELWRRKICTCVRKKNTVLSSIEVLSVTAVVVDSMCFSNQFIYCSSRGVFVDFWFCK